MHSSDKFHILGLVPNDQQNILISDEPASSIGSNFPLDTKKVLIIDDNKVAADGLKMLFKAMGWNAQSIYSGRELLEFLSTESATIAFIDIGMPEMNGYEVIQEVRARGFSLPAVALTGYGQTEDIEKALSAGFTAHLTKPAGIQDFKRILSELKLDPA
jgi:two-component system CheB/CheR fusion protein